MEKYLKIALAVVIGLLVGCFVWGVVAARLSTTGNS
jgi:uncharacterized membrane-anchored protein YhcB (DUF1043 family)